MSSKPAELRAHADRAMMLARRAIVLAPNSCHAHHALALALWFSGDTVRSLESYQTAFSLNPNDTDLMADMGLRHCLQMDWERGVPMLEESYRRNPCQAGSYRMGLVLYHFSTGNHEEALRQTGLIDAPDVVYTHLVTAACAERLGRRDEARAAVARIEQMESAYAKRVVFDLAARNVHPKLAQDLILALRDAGLAVTSHPAQAKMPGA
jgi:Tfp pilus assembly protein PilF